MTNDEKAILKQAVNTLGLLDRDETIDSAKRVLLRAMRFNLTIMLENNGVMHISDIEINEWPHTAAQLWDCLK